MKIRRFEDIEAWQLASELTRKVYRLTKKPGFSKDYGLKKKYEARKATNREPSYLTPQCWSLFFDQAGRFGGQRRR